MSSIARSMLAELTYIVLLLVNRFLAWFTWKQAGITDYLPLTYAGTVYVVACDDSICAQLLCLERLSRSVNPRN